MKDFTAKEQIFLLDIMVGNLWLFLDRTSLFIILTFAVSTIQNSWASPLSAANRTIGELVLFEGSYISRLYGKQPLCDHKHFCVLKN